MASHKLSFIALLLIVATAVSGQEDGLAPAFAPSPTMITGSTSALPPPMAVLCASLLSLFAILFH
ncbi:hypothetical protein AMTRI_Chr03g45170 [Amborella trichopoda]